jgi:hypothetical protein
VREPGDGLLRNTRTGVGAEGIFEKLSSTRATT